MEARLRRAKIGSGGTPALLLPIPRAIVECAGSVRHGFVAAETAIPGAELAFVRSPRESSGIDPTGALGTWD